MQTEREWKLPEPPCSALVSELIRELQLSNLAANCLVSRGISTPEKASAFLSPNLNHLHDPMLFHQMEKAVDRIWQAVDKKEPILIHGDYDADGITATTLLLQFFDLLGVAAKWHIPNRLTEGFSFSPRVLKRVEDEGIKLCITVDNGISAVEEVKQLTALGCDTIVTDHHEPGPRLPEAIALLDPKVPDSGYPFSGLAGVGVAFKLAWATARRFSGSEKVNPAFRRFLYEAVQLVALGTVADIVPLIDENRDMVYQGLLAMGRSAPAGLEALKSSCNISGRRLTTIDIAFRLAPRINAAGRIGQAELGVELFREQDPEQRTRITDELEAANRKRQKVEKDVLAQANKMLRDEPALDQLPILLLAGRGWSPGVLGIVASRLGETRPRPILLAAIQDGIGRGSARSPSGFPIHTALEKANDLLISHGGHARAAGFKVAADQIDPLRDRLVEVAREMNTTPPPLTVDASAGLEDMTPGLVAELEKLAPFGAANPAPVFGSTDLEIVGRPWHSGYGGNDLSFLVRHGETTRQAVIKGGKHENTQAICRGVRLAMAYSPAMVWRGDDVELRVKALCLEKDSPNQEEQVQK